MSLLAVFVVTAGGALYLYRGRITDLWLTVRTRRCLNRLGLQQIAQFQCPDGLGNYYTVDRLLLCPDGISLLQFKRYSGSIFCSEHIEEWTQILGGKSYRFKNPLVDLEYQISAVSACVPGVPVNGFVLFDHTAEFPKGHPDRVIQPGAVPESIRRNKTEQAQAPVLTAWEKLRSLS